MRTQHNFCTQQLRYVGINMIFILFGTRQQFSVSLDYFVTSSPPYLHQFSTISGGNCIRLTVSSFDSQANQSNQSSIQRELLMKSSISLSLTTKSYLIPFDQIKEPLRLPEQQIGSEQVPQHPPHPASTELEEFFQSFKVLLQPSNKLKIISHSNLSSTTLTLDKHSSTASTTNTGLVYLTSICGDLHQHIHSKQFCHKRVCED